MHTRQQVPRLVTVLSASLLPLSALAIDEVESPPDHRVLRHEVVVDATPEQVWQAWTTSDGLASFFCPESKVELKLGGAFDLYMTMKEPDETGGRGSEGCKILSYIPHEMLSFEWNFPPKVMSLRKAGAKTHVVLRFERAWRGKTRVRLAQLGWRTGKDWDAGYRYFDAAWSNVLKSLRDRFARSPADEDSARPRVQGRTKTWRDGPVRVKAIYGPDQRQEFTVDVAAPVEKVWELLATSDGLRRLGGKETLVQLEPGGAYAFWPGANNKVLSYSPNEMLSTSGSAPPQFPNVRKGGTWSAYFFERKGEGSTRLRLVAFGWRPGEKEWDDAFEYFLKNNPVFLKRVFRMAADYRSAMADDVLRHEAIIGAPVGDVWRAFTTQDGIESWMVAHGEVDLRVGGKMRTHYDPKGVLGDDGTIENTILSFDPMRMLSIKATKPPASFPYKEQIKNMWSVIYFEPVGTDRTRVIIHGLGYGGDEGSQKMRAHFEWGNAWTLKKLAEKFQPKEESSAHLDPTARSGSTQPAAK